MVELPKLTGPSSVPVETEKTDAESYTYGGNSTTAVDNGVDFAQEMWDSVRRAYADATSSGRLGTRSCVYSSSTGDFS